MTFRSALLPIYNAGQAVTFGIFLLIVIAIAAFDDAELAAYIGIGGYAGAVVFSMLGGLAPSQVEIQRDEIASISALLANEHFIVPIEERVWAPASSRSPWFKSDWISIDETGDGKLILKGRKRDLKIILSEIR